MPSLDIEHGRSAESNRGQVPECVSSPGTIASQVENGGVQIPTRGNAADSQARPQLAEKNHPLASDTGGIARWKPWSFHPGFILIAIVGSHLLQVSLICWVLSNYKTLPSAPLFAFGGNRTSAYFAWRFIPVLSAVLLGLLWGIVDLDVRRLEPFHQMSLRQGATIKESLSLDYGSTLSLLVPFKSIWRRHYFVALSSTIYLMAFFALPILHDNMWEINYDTSSGVFTVVVNKGWVYTTLGLTVAIVVLAGTLTWEARKREYGLVSDPAGLASLASLVYDSNVLKHFKDIPAIQPQSFIDTKLRNCRFSLKCIDIAPSERGGSTSIWVNQIVSDVDRDKGPTMGADPPPQQSIAPRSQSRWKAHPWSLSGRFLLLTGLLGLGPCIAIMVGANLLVFSTISWSPRMMRSLCMLDTVIQTALWTLMDADLRLTEPWRQLSLVRSTDRAVRMEAIIVDWEQMNPVSSFILGLSKGRATLVVWVSFAGLLSQVTTVVFPALFDTFWSITYAMSKSSFDSLSIEKIPALLLESVRILGFVTYPIVLMQSVIWLCLFSRRKPVLPRKPSTMASKILYICWSTKLLQDVRDACGRTVEERAENLRVRNRDYMFGWFEEGGQMRLGVEEQLLVTKYTYGQAGPTVETGLTGSTQGVDNNNLSRTPI